MFTAPAWCLKQTISHSSLPKPIFTHAGYVIISVPNAPPQNVQVDATSVHTARVSWTPPPADQQNGVIRSYTVRLTNVVTRERSEFTTTLTTHQLSSLQANTQYSVAVAASTRVGTGPFSQSVALETGTTSEYKMNIILLPYSWK